MHRPEQCLPSLQVLDVQVPVTAPSQPLVISTYEIQTDPPVTGSKFSALALASASLTLGLAVKMQVQ